MTVSKNTVLNALKGYNEKLQSNLKETFATKIELTNDKLPITIGPTQPTDGSIWLDTSRYEQEGS